MQSSLREDILEALYKVRCSSDSKVSISDLVLLLSRPSEDLVPILPELERSGDLILESDGGISLTPCGIDTGGKIMRKHRILECFFSEMLGMSPEIASEEACTLEHKVSDEAIDRLGRYLKGPGFAGKWGRRRGWNCPVMTLMDSSVGIEMVVSCIRCHGPVSRLQDLGIFPGESIRVIRRIRDNGVVVKVKDCDIALSREIAASIFVEKAE
jgi:DtxR family Mn-dependent transcriptional regulator